MYKNIFIKKINKKLKVHIQSLIMRGYAPRDLTDEDLKNIETNIRIAIPNMTRVYNLGLQKILKGPDLLKHVANTPG